MIKVAGWAGGAFTDDKTGQFSNCIASANYKSGINFGVIVTNTMNWGLAFSHPNWNLTQGQKFPIVLSFDGRNTFNVDGVMMASNAVLVAMPDNSALIGNFRAAKTMSAFAQGSLFQFSLDGTSILLPALVSCVKTVNAGGIASAGDFTAPLSATKTAKQTPQPPVGGSLAPGPQTGPADMQIEAIELATNFILKTSLRNPQVLSRSETPVAIAASGAAWRSDEAAGTVRIIPPREGMKGIDVTAAIVAGDAKNCGGKFASGRMSELVDSDVVFRGFSSCEDSAGARISQYFLVSRKKGGFVLFSVASGMKTEAKAVAKDERLADFRKAAWVVVNQ